MARDWAGQHGRPRRRYRGGSGQSRRHLCRRGDERRLEDREQRHYLGAGVRRRTEPVGRRHRHRAVESRTWSGSEPAKANGRQGYFLRRRAIFKSTDAGQTWTFYGARRQAAPSAASRRSNNPDTVYVAAAGDLFKTDPERGLYKTVDGGTHLDANRSSSTRTPGSSTWRWIRRTARRSVAASYQRRRTAWGFNGGGPGSALWKTTDAGKNVENGSRAAACPAYGKWGRAGLAFSRSNPNIVYAMIEPGPAGRRRRRRAAREPHAPSSIQPRRHLALGGQRRHLEADEQRERPRDVLQPDSRRPERREHGVSRSSGALQVDRRRADVQNIPEGALVAAARSGADAVCPCAPFDSAIDRADLPPSHPDHHAMWIDPANPKHIILGHDGGVDFSYDGGRTWQLQNCDADGAVLSGGGGHAAAGPR